MLEALAAIGGSLLSGYLNNSAASDRQEDAQKFSAEQFASRYQTTVKDMQAAGLNPMLAYSQGGGSPPTSSAASSSGYADIGSNINQSRINSAQIALLEANAQKAKAETANVEADTQVKLQQPAVQAAQVSQLGASAAQSQATSDQIRQNLTAWEVTYSKLQAERDQAYQRLQTMGYENASARAQAQVDVNSVNSRIDALKASASNLKSQAVITGLDVPRALNEAAFEKAASDAAGSKGVGIAGRVIQGAAAAKRILGK